MQRRRRRGGGARCRGVHKLTGAAASYCRHMQRGGGRAQPWRRAGAPQCKGSRVRVQMRRRWSVVLQPPCKACLPDCASWRCVFCCASSVVCLQVPPAAKGAAQGEAATVAAFLRDPYGCSGTLLAKKSRRDPFAVGAPHPSRCPAMAGLLQHCGSRPYAGALPWDRGKAGAVAAAKAAAGAGKVQGRHSSRSGIYT